MKFAKYILGVNKTSSNMAVLGDLGMFPCSTDALKLAVGYWHHLVNSSTKSLIYTVYNSAHDANWFKLKIKSLFEKIQFEHIWNNHNSFSKNRLIFSVHRKLKEKFILLWKDRVSQDNNPTPGNQGNKLRTYNMFKKEFEMENFLKIDVERKILSDFVKIRISNSNLLIETGRHKNLALEKRICPLCKAEIENEIHFLCRCVLLSEARTNFFNTISNIIPSFSNFSEEEKFKLVFTSNDYNVSKHCMEGIRKLYNIRNELIKE